MGARRRLLSDTATLKGSSGMCTLRCRPPFPVQIVRSSDDQVCELLLMRFKVRPGRAGQGAYSHITCG
jgi:hypothetical protein